MAKKEFVYTVKVDTGDGVKEVEKVAKSINDFEEGIAGLQEELNSAPLGSDKFKKLSKELKGAEKQFEKAKIKSQSLGDSLSSIPGPIGGVIQGIKGFGQALKVLAMNPIGAVITAIVVAVTALYKAFTSTKAGAEKMEQVMAGLSAVLDVLRDRVLKVGGAIVKFFKGDFSGAADDMRGAFKGIGDEIATEFKAAADATKQLQRVEDRQRALNVERAKTNKLISEAKQKINDENLSYAEREAALEEVRQKEIALAKQEQKLAEDRYAALKALADLSDSSKEQLDELAAAEAEVYNRQKETADKQKELADQAKALRDRRRAEQKAAAEKRKQELQALADFEQQLMLDLITDAEEKTRKELEIQRDADLKEIDQLRTSEEHKQELRKQAQQKYLNSVQELEDEITKTEEEAEAERQAAREAAAQKRMDTYKSDLDIMIGLQNVTNEEELERLKGFLLQKLNLELANEELTQAQILQITENYNQAIAAADQKLLDQDKVIAQQKLDLAMQGLNSLIMVAGKESALGKAAAVSQALVNTFLGVTEALSQKSTLPSPGDVIAKIANVGAILTSGMAAVQNIRGVNLPKMREGGLVSGEGSGTSDSITTQLSNGESVINAQSTAMFTPLLSAINQAGGGRAITNDLMPSNQMPAVSSPVMKTYVVAGDVSNEVELDRQVKSRSII